MRIIAMLNETIFSYFIADLFSLFVPDIQMLTLNRVTGVTKVFDILKVIVNAYKLV